MDKGRYINPCELTAAVTASANLIAKALSDDELSLFATVLAQLSDTLITIYTVRAMNKELCEKDGQSTEITQTKTTQNSGPN